MTASVRLGFGIAAQFAAGVVVVSAFGNHQSWLIRAAADNAVRCLTASPCARIEPRGAIMRAAPPPLPATSRCAKPGTWSEVKSASNGATRIVLTCTDGKAFLYHMGKLTDPASGNEQWLACSEPACETEVELLKRTM